MDRVLVVSPPDGSPPALTGVIVPSAEEALDRLARRDHGVDVLVLSAAVPEPLDVAQRAHLVDRDVSVLVLAEADAQPRIARALEFAPFLGDDVAALSEDDPALADGIAAAAERAAARRALRGLPGEPERTPPAEQVLGQLLAHAPMGVAVVDRKGALVGWNRRAGEILGASEEETIGAPLAGLFEPEDGRELEHFVRSAASVGATSAPAQLRLRGNPAAARYVEVTVGPLTGRSGERGAMVAVRDVTEGHEAESRLRFLAVATEILAESLEYDETLGRIARLAVPRLADWCIVDELRPSGEIARVAVVARTPPKQAAIEELRRLYPPTWDSPQPAGRALREGGTVVAAFDSADDLRTATRDERHFELIAELDPREAVAVPLVARGETIGVITFSFAESGRSYGAADVELAEGIARRAALALDRARLYRAEQEARVAAEKAREEGVFLAEATEVLASSLDFAETVDAIASLAVPRLADWCIVYVVEEDGRIRRLAVQHVDPATRARVEAALDRFQLDPSADAAVPKVIRTREPEFHPEANLELLAADVDDPERFQRVLEGLRPTSWMCLPLVSSGESLGAISFFTAEPGRRYGEHDLALAREIARRAALAVDQARAHRREQQARRAAEEAGERLTFLAEAGALLAESLHYEVTLERLARLTVPAIADCCVVDVLHEGREVRQVAVAHVDPAREALVRELERRYPTDEGEARSPVGRALRDGRTVFLEDLARDAGLIARDDEHLRGLRELGLVSGIIVPLVVREETLGAITILSAESGRRYGPADVTLAEQLAERAALAVENARLYAEAEARGQAARALATVGDGVVLVDARGVVRLWNPAAEAITGLPAADVVGRAAADVLPGWADVVRLAPVARSPGPGPTRPQTIPIDLPGGEAWLSFAGVGFADGTVFTFRDLTEERRVEELKTEFVATASHELRTPLAAVYGAAMTLTRRRAELDEEQRSMLLSVIADEADRLAKIVNDILWASRVDAGEEVVEIAPFDARDVARRVVEAAHAHLAPGVELELVAPDEVPLVAADEQKLSQVLANLVDNAIKYSPDGGPVQLTLEPRDGKLVFAVRDEGLGIPEHEQPRIFEKFYRLDPNLTRGVGGTGLGLYICRELVRRMHGRIWVASREGEGSTFSVELPLADRAGVSVG